MRASAAAFLASLGEVGVARAVSQLLPFGSPKGSSRSFRAPVTTGPHISGFKYFFVFFFFDKLLKYVVFRERE